MLKNLINRIKEEKCILFAGAGTSLDARLLSCYELLKNMIEQVDACGQLDKNQKEELEVLINQQDFTIIAKFCKEKLGSKAVADLIKEKLNTKNKISMNT